MHTTLSVVHIKGDESQARDALSLACHVIRKNHLRVDVDTQPFYLVKRGLFRTTVRFERFEVTVSCARGDERDLTNAVKAIGHAVTLRAATNWME